MCNYTEVNGDYSYHKEEMLLEQVPGEQILSSANSNEHLRNHKMCAFFGSEFIYNILRLIIWSTVCYQYLLTVKTLKKDIGEIIIEWFSNSLVQSRVCIVSPAVKRRRRLQHNDKPMC